MSTTSRRLLVLALASSLLAACGGGGGGNPGSTSGATASGDPSPGSPAPPSPGTGGTDPGGAGVSTGATVLTPDVPPASQVAFEINSSLSVKPISRFIYGINSHDFGTRPRNLTLTRFGGNRATAYNWENNASNAGTDYFNENDAFLSSSNAPGAAVTPSIDQAQAAGASNIVTIPTIGYVAADKSPGGDVNQTPNYLATRFRVSVAHKTTAFTLNPDPSGAFVYQDEFVNFLDQRYPRAKTDATRTIFYELDNEPDLWATTHPRLRGAATGSSGTGVTYAELIQRSTDYAGAIKHVVPEAVVFGPVNYGWEGMITLQNASDAAGRDFLDFYLQQMAAAGATAGKRLIDVMDIHWYPEAVGNDATGTPTRIINASADPGVVAARLAAPRSLWDSTYTETSWITQDSTNGPINLLPRLQQKIVTNYAGTKLAITEYNYGGSDDISGGIAQADVLGIFGRQGVFAAALWPLYGNNTFIFGGFESFRNFDGNGGSFGDTSIQATNSDSVTTSVYASVDKSTANRMVIVAINRTASAKTSAIRVWHTVRLLRAIPYTLTSANVSPVVGATLPITLNNALQYTMPPYSVTTLVLTP